MSSQGKINQLLKEKNLDNQWFQYQIPEILLTENLKALSIWQPYAELIKAGIKTYETRSWKTNYRGKLLICSALKTSKKQNQIYLNIMSNHNLTHLQPYQKLYFGYGICLCELVDCLEITIQFRKKLPQLQLQCGNWIIGHYAWQLNNIQPLKPFPVKGQQRLFNVKLNLNSLHQICPSCEQPLINLSDGCEICGWISPKKEVVQNYKDNFFLGEIEKSSTIVESIEKSPKKEVVQNYKDSFFLGEIDNHSTTLIPCVIKQPGQSELKGVVTKETPDKLLVKVDNSIICVPKLWVFPDLPTLEKSAKLSQISPKKNPSGHLSPTINRKKDKLGRLVEYPKVNGERVSIDLAWEYPHQFFWLYNWSVKDHGRWKNKSKSVPRNRIWTVRNAIASNKPVDEILKLINGDW